jgi:hypothetical protein
MDAPKKELFYRNDCKVNFSNGIINSDKTATFCSKLKNMVWV